MPWSGIKGYTNKHNTMIETPFTLPQELGGK